MRLCRRLVFILFLPLAAGGCVLPPAVTVASLAADAVSYAATGKSVTDHGLSAATAHDCALLRPLLTRKPICDTSGERGRDVPVVDGAAAVSPCTSAPPRVAAAGRAVAANDRYVCLGTFGDAATARAAAARYASLRPADVTVEAQGRVFHRLVVGPLSADAATALEARLAAQIRTAQR